MPFPLLLAGGLAAGAGFLGNLFGGRKANRELDRLAKMDPTYAANPLAAERLGLTKTQLNAEMPGAELAKQGILSNEANQINRASMGATDSSAFLSLANAISGNTNDAYVDLATKGAEDYQRRFANYSDANAAQVAEGDKVYQDQVRRFEDMAKIKGAQAQNRVAPWNSLFGAGTSLLTAGLFNKKAA